MVEWVHGRTAIIPSNPRDPTTPSVHDTRPRAPSTRKVDSFTEHLYTAVTPVWTGFTDDGWLGTGAWLRKCRDGIKHETRDNCTGYWIRFASKFNSLSTPRYTCTIKIQCTKPSFPYKSICYKLELSIDTGKDTFVLLKTSGDPTRVVFFKRFMTRVIWIFIYIGIYVGRPKKSGATATTTAAAAAFQLSQHASNYNVAKTNWLWKVSNTV